ncbi:decreased expression in renal and prostate cancer protein-like isoform X3 [Ruditapes philippinarum]|uniref:decreased expression in renal and prostate cancer protein-like isoform X3 n=1 Tax=Ruditapes philippinarum TaxID=129788 RepID=UPI00295B65D5|nr:decreased expression in renal and prostate cancer protein-like isoform X3 [Ruditapes philippinarum]
MDSQNYIINIFSLILCIFPNILYTQRITCPTPCDIGYTCAMVRHGTQPSAPGCISMQEAILLHQAINGGPSGPGSGINNQVGVGIQQQTPGFPQAPRPGDPIPPFPQGAGGTIPGMNFLGSTDPREPGFEQRFALGLGGQQRNFGFGPPGQVNGQFGRPQVPTGMSGPAFLDPTAGQFAGQAPGQFLGPSGGQFGPNAGQFGPNAGQFGPNAGQFGPNPGQFGGPPPGQFGPSAGQFGPGGPMGFNPQVDGGQNISSSASGIRDNTNIAWHDFSRGGGSFPRPGLSDNRAGSFQQITDAVDQTPIRIGQLGQLPRNFVERPGTFGTRQGRFGLQPRTDTFDPNSNQFGAAGIEIPSVGFNPQVVDLSIAPTPSVPHNRDMNNQISNDFSHVSHEGSHSQFDRSRQSTGGFGSMSSVPDQTAGQFDPQPHVDGDKSHISHGSDNNFPQRNSRFQGSNVARIETNCKGCEATESCPSGQYCYFSYACAIQICQPL